MAPSLMGWRSQFRMVLVAMALVGSTLTAWASQTQAQVLSDGQREKLNERDKFERQANALAPRARRRRPSKPPSQCLPSSARCWEGRAMMR